MRSLHVLDFVLLISLAIIPASAFQSQPTDLPNPMRHPAIAATPDEIARLRAAWQSTGPEHDLLAQTIKWADNAVRKPIVFPPRGGQHNQWYQCQSCQMGLKTIDDTHHQCPRCKKVYSGPPYDDVIFLRQHNQILNHARSAAWAYAITGDEKYAAHVRKVLIGYAERYRKYPWHNANLTQTGTGGGHMFEQTLDEASAMAGSIAPAYDLVYSSKSMSAADRHKIDNGLILPLLQNLARNKRETSNWQSYHNAAMLAGGVMLHDARWVDRAINDPKNGFLFQMEHSITADGMWFENSWSYHFYTLTALTETAEYARRIGIDLWGKPMLRKMYATPALYQMPDGSLPRFGDAVDTMAGSATKDFESAWRATHDPALAPMLVAEPTFESILYGRDTNAPRPKASSFASRQFPGAGQAILRGPGPAGLTSVLNFGPDGGFHGHLDKNNFVLFAHGVEIANDPGRARSQAYRLPIHKNWYKATISHNTVIVDRTSQQPATGKPLFFESGSVFSIAAAANNDSYPGVEHVRTLVQSPEYLLVIDELKSDRPHRYDFVYHNTGSTVGAMVPVKPAKITGFTGMEYVKNIKTGASDGEIGASFGGDGMVTYLTLDAQAGTGILIGDGPAGSVMDRMPMAMFTREGAGARFAAVIEPVVAGANRQVQSVELSQQGNELVATVKRETGRDVITIGADHRVTVKHAER
ncbi:heparinase II/III family protein [bacterium]|nr:heparinase II/III family protein [bacterium]